MNYDDICQKPWVEITEEELQWLYIDEDFLKSEIADIFNISKGQVSYKLSKYKISKQKEWFKEALLYSLKDVKQSALEEAIFGIDEIIPEDNDELKPGPVKIIGGEFSGRIGCFLGIEDSNGLICFGDINEALGPYVEIPTSNLSNRISTYDLINRSRDLQVNIISSKDNSSSETNQDVKDQLIKMYEEYLLILKLLNRIYTNTTYLQGSGESKVFVSHSSADKDIAQIIAADLKLANINVWFDKWDLKLGHSIPQEICNGLEEADALLIILSKDYIQSAFCRDEWQSYYMRYNSTGRPILVVIVDESEVPILLASRKYYRLDSMDKYNDMLAEVKSAIKAIAK